MRRVGLFWKDKTICAETEGDTVTLHRPDLSLRSIEFDCDWEGRGGEAAEDDGKGQLEIHELD